MAKKKEITYNLEEIIEVLGERENNDWVKVLSKISWNDNMPQMDIRNMNLANLMDNDTDKVIFGKGITLNDVEVERLVKALLRQGYVDDEEIYEILNERNAVFTLPKKTKKMLIKMIK